MIWNVKIMYGYSSYRISVIYAHGFLMKCFMVILWAPNVPMCKLKIMQNFYRSDVQVTFELYGHFRCLQVLFFLNKTTFTRYCLTKWISNLPVSFEIKSVKQYLVNFTGLTSIVNITIYKTKSILTDLGHGKFSYFLTLHVSYWLIFFRVVSLHQAIITFS